MITLTAKLQILPDEKQAGLLQRTMQAYKNACNFVSDYVYETHDLKAASINKALYKDIRFEFIHKRCCQPAHDVTSAGEACHAYQLSKSWETCASRPHTNG